MDAPYLPTLSDEVIGIPYQALAQQAERDRGIRLETGPAFQQVHDSDAGEYPVYVRPCAAKK
jgi:hypothetical protein